MTPYVLKKQPPHRLTEIVESQMRAKYPGLEENRLHSFFSRFRIPIPVLAWVAIAVFLVFWGSNELLLSHGIVFATYSLNSESASDILISSFDYLAILIGIVIPVVLLVVPYVEGVRLSSIMDIYLNRIGVKQATVLAVIVLALESLAVWLAKTSVVNSEKALLYLTFLFVLLNLTVLLETARVIRRVIQMLSTRSLVEALLDKLTLEAKKSQQSEARYRLNRLASANLYKMLQIKKVPVFFRPLDLIPISLPSAGLIQDIDLPALTQLVNKLQHPALAQGEEKILVTRLVGDDILGNQVLAFISPKESDQAGEIQKLLSKAFVLGKNSRDTGELQNLLEQVKSRTEFAIREHDEELFERMLGVYTTLFNLYIDLPLPPSADPIPGFFRGWSAIISAILQLHEITKTASRDGDDKTISHLTYFIHNIAAMVIFHTEERLSESFPNVLRLFITMYDVSFNARNQTGMGQSFYYLTGDLVDQTWTRKLQSVQDNLQAIQNLYTALADILQTQAELLRDMVRNQDVENFKLLVYKMQPDEQLAYFTVIIPDRGERFRLQNQLLEAPLEQRTSLEQRLEALTMVEGIRRKASSFFAELLFVIAGYMVEGYEQHEFTPEYTNQILRIIQQSKYFCTFPKTVDLLRELTAPSAYFEWNWFNRHPDTKQTFSPDDERKYLLFYCLNGIVQQLEIEAPLSADLQARLPRIKQICEHIAATASIWQLILGIDALRIEQLAKDFIEINQRICDAWQTDKENQVIAADLDPEKIAIFSKKVISTIETAEGLRPLLKRYGRFNIVSDIPGKLMWGVNIWAQDKEDFTAFSQGVNLIEDSGVEFGSRLVQIERDNLIHQCIAAARSFRTRKDWTTLEPYFTAALAEFQQAGYQAGLILVPHSLQYELFQNLPGFENPEANPDAIPGLRGYYQSIPILGWYFGKTEPILLFWDIAKAFQLDVEKPVIEVRPLTDAERAKILKENPHVKERKLLLSVGIKVAEKFRLSWIDKRAILKQPLKLSKSNYFILDS